MKNFIKRLTNNIKRSQYDRKVIGYQRQGYTKGNARWLAQNDKWYPKHLR